MLWGVPQRSLTQAPDPCASFLLVVELASSLLCRWAGFLGCFPQPLGTRVAGSWTTQLCSHPAPLITPKNLPSPAKELGQDR